MKLTRLIAMLDADCITNGDTENVTFGISIIGVDGKRYRLDVLLDESNFGIVRDCNYVNGMACLVADHSAIAEANVTGESA